MDQPISRSGAVLRRAARHFHVSQCDPGVLERADRPRNDAPVGVDLRKLPVES